MEFEKTGNTEGLEIYFDVNPHEAFAAASQKATRLGKKGPNWKEQEVQAQTDESLYKLKKTEWRVMKIIFKILLILRKWHEI